jgi:signal peptidase II
LTRRYGTALGIAAVIVALDLWSKRYAATHFKGNPVELLGGFMGFTYVENPGGAFGSFRGGGTVIAIAAMIVTIVVLVALARPRPRGEVIALGFVIGGAVGNLVDRFARGDGLVDGPVIDWINLWFIPTFNMADMSVTVGVVILVLVAWWNR